MEQINAGDVVVLKSGSPAMTVRWINGNECYAEWFDGSDLKGHKFNPVSLESAT